MELHSIGRKRKLPLLSYQKSIAPTIRAQWNIFAGFFIEQMVFSQPSSFTALILQRNENKMQQTVTELGSEEQF